MIYELQVSGGSSGLADGVHRLLYHLAACVDLPYSPTFEVEVTVEADPVPRMTSVTALPEQVNVSKLSELVIALHDADGLNFSASPRDLSNAANSLIVHTTAWPSREKRQGRIEGLKHTGGGQYSCRLVME